MDKEDSNQDRLEVAHAVVGDATIGSLSLSAPLALGPDVDERDRDDQILEAMAAISAEVEKQGRESISLLKDIVSGQNRQHKAGSERGKKWSNNISIGPSEIFQSQTTSPESSKNDKKRPEENKEGSRKRQSAHSELVVEGQPRSANILFEQEKTPLGEKQNHRKETGRASEKPAKSEYSPTEKRKKRTIDLEAPAPAPEHLATPAPHSAPAQAPAPDQAQAPAQPSAPSNLGQATPAGEVQRQADAISPPPAQPGYYMGDDGKLRRPDGKYANKLETRRWTKGQEGGEQGDNSGDGGKNYDHSLLKLTAKAVGILMTGGAAARMANTRAGEAGGLAMGGSFFMAGRELVDMGTEIKEALNERDIHGLKDLGGYLKKKAAPITSMFSRGDREQATKKAADTPAPRRPPQLPSPGSKPQAQPARHAGQEKSGQAFAKARESDQANRRAKDQTNLLEENHGELINKLEEVIEAVKPSSPGLLDGAMSMAGDAFERRRGRRGKNRRTTSTRKQPAPGREPRSWRKRDATEPSPRRRQPIADTGMPRSSKVAAVRAAMPSAMPALPSVVAGGAIAAEKVGVRTAARGVGSAAMLAGAKAIPIAGQILTAGLAAYDGIQGYGDREAQARTFDLQDGQEATVGQKSATAIARVLDLGGLTSGAAGVAGTLAGAVGFKGLQDALAFDPDDMAKAIYRGMMLFDNKTPDKKATGDRNTTINNMNPYGTGHRQGAVTDDTGSWPGTPLLKFDDAEAQNGLPANYLDAVLQVESGGDFNATNKQSGAKGGWQFMDKTARGLGLKNPYDPVESTKAMIEHTKQNAKYFENNMGRKANGRELYLLHQQGMSGGTKLLKNPNALASSVVGADAVMQNGGNMAMTSQQLIDMIVAKYDKAEAEARTNTKPGANVQALLDASGMAKDTKPASQAVPPMLAAPGNAPEQTRPAPGNAPAPSIISETAAGGVAVPGSTSAPVPPIISEAAAGGLAPPVLLSAQSVQAPATRPVADIQEIKAAKTLAEKTKSGPTSANGEPDRAVATDGKMLTTLQNIEKLLKEQGKADKPATPGRVQGQSGKASVSGHRGVSTHVADLARDRG